MQEKAIHVYLCLNNIHIDCNPPRFIDFPKKLIFLQ